MLIHLYFGFCSRELFYSINIEGAFCSVSTLVVKDALTHINSFKTHSIHTNKGVKLKRKHTAAFSLKNFDKSTKNSCILAEEAL